VGGVVFGDYQHPCCVAVKAMDNARPPRVAALGQFLIVIDQGVYEGAVFAAAGRMHNQIRLLVHHQHIIVLVEDIERNILRYQLAHGARGENQINLIAGIQLAAGLGRPAVDIDPLLFD